MSDAADQLVGTQLFGRELSLTIGFPNNPDLDQKVAFTPSNSQGRDVSGLDVAFRIEKALKPDEPNTCSVRVWGLAESTRAKMSGHHNLTLRLEAGYKGAVSQLYFAEVRSAWTAREGPEYITHFESSDTVARPSGVRRVKKPQPGSVTGSIYVTKGPRVPLEDAFRAITDALGIGEGNLRAALAGRPNKALASVRGGALFGPGRQRMTDLCRSAGLEWSIQDGNLQLLNIGQALSTTKAILISESTGMVESPQVDSQGAVSVKTLLIPGLAPGGLVNIDSLFVSGGYRVEKCRYVGERNGQDWFVEFDAVKY